MLLGQTLDGMRLWDARRAIQTINSLETMQNAKLALSGSDVSAGIALYTSLFEPTVTSCDLKNLPDTHGQGPIFLNVLRYMDIPQAIEIANQHCQIRIHKQ
jgi:cephalosporin-C deacetylase-like acetyl esterase